MVGTPEMRLDGDMAPNMGTTINEVACATNGRKLNSASQIYSSSVPTGAIGHNVKKKKSHTTEDTFIVKYPQLPATVTSHQSL
ncbi:hypothetical protein E2C01_068466 [Portunus trituberculatus]|uniref:Uncharacterized protein n=1 Tax=Portunus trituberculatus TaxID=210409 RepID=A0A5B7HZI1_PORTR|nr:hypothetical protein [Portunus trituberculatus]